MKKLLIIWLKVYSCSKILQSKTKPIFGRGRGCDLEKKKIRWNGTTKDMVSFVSCTLKLEICKDNISYWIVLNIRSCITNPK